MGDSACSAKSRFGEFGAMFDCKFPTQYVDGDVSKVAGLVENTVRMVSDV